VTTRLVVQRSDIRDRHWQEVPSPELADGEVRMHVDAFALTANNITYAAIGDVMNYWGFFPTGDPATGCVPVWGFADVTESRCAGIEPGERFYGYWPVADEVVLSPADVRTAGFVDGAEHRHELPPIYNQYTRCSADPGYAPEREAQQALLRPLFATAFFLDDFFTDNGDFGAETVIMSSASSKTAYGTAFCLSQRPHRPRVIGLTSPRNAEFVGALGCYDEVIHYDDITSALPDEPSVYIDFSGSASVRTAVHRRLADRLRYSCAVGLTHWDATGGGDQLPGPAPVLFFAPAQVAKRTEEWGGAVVQQRLGQAWEAFLVPVTRAENPWLTVVRGRGTDAVDTCYTALLDGTVPADEGHVLSVR
jgi:hypothetical protein